MKNEKGNVCNGSPNSSGFHHAIGARKNESIFGNEEIASVYNYC